MEQFTAAASSWSSFLSGDKRRGYKPVAAQDAPPAGPSLSILALCGDPMQDRGSLHFLKEQRLSAKAVGGPTRVGVQTPGGLLARCLGSSLRDLLRSAAPGGAGCA